MAVIVVASVVVAAAAAFVVVASVVVVVVVAVVVAVVVVVAAAAVVVAVVGLTFDSEFAVDYASVLASAWKFAEELAMAMPFPLHPHHPLLGVL